MRSRQFERNGDPAASGVRAVTPTANNPYYFGDPVNRKFLMTNVNGGLDSFDDVTADPNNWRYYRYRVYERVIPLRNMLWGGKPMPFIHATGAGPGVVLFVALIVLIIMTLAGLALLRQMGAGTSIAGNIAFKENATSVADRGTEFANAWLTHPDAAITATDSVANGYLSSWGNGVDPTTSLGRARSKRLADRQRKPAIRHVSSSSGSA